MNYVIGFDLSSTCVGLSILDEKAKIVYSDFIDLSKLERNIDVKLDYCFEYIDKNLQLYIKNIKMAGAEAALEKFSGGSSAHTLAILIAFNQAFCYYFYKKYGIPVVRVTFTEARKNFGIKIPKAPKKTPKSQKDKMKKEFIMECVKKRWPEIVWEVNKMGNLDKKNYDVADSLVIAQYVSDKTTNITTDIS